MNTKYLMAGSIILFALLSARRSDAQAVFSEDFTGASTTNSWYFFRGACLTASSANAGANPSKSLPGCTSSSLQSAYYFGENQVGGTAGAGGNGQTLPDQPTSSGVQTGALRFTNGAPFGHNEGGAIISATGFNSSNGVQITFKSVTYRGDSGGTSGDGADGISFFMINGSAAPSIGSEGGSLAYTCSNPGNIGGHAIIDGVTGAYIGLGIDEYGNFLNSGDNTASGITSTVNAATQQQGDRIGLRGAGNVSWYYLNYYYSSYYPSSLTAAQQQAAVAATCQSGYLWNYSNPASPVAVTTGGSTTTLTSNGKLTKNSNVITSVAPIPTGLVVGATVTDPNGYIPANSTVTAIGANSITFTPANQATHNSTSETFTYTSSTPGQVVAIADYQAIPGGSAILTGVNIANENAMSRGAATPIFYNLRITANGLLSLSYSLSGAAYQSIIADKDITAISGTMPTSLLFGFAGSTGGSTNIHEIMCFKAAPQNTSGSSATVNEKESAKVESTSQAFFAFYDPNVWTGTVTANTLVDTNGVVTVYPQSNWDAGCLLTGNTNCANSKVTYGSTAVPIPSARIMMTWDAVNNVGVPFEWTSTSGTANLNSLQEANLDALDTNSSGAPTETSQRLFYLRGSRTNEVTTTGVGLYRPRASILGDIVDSSPTWVGPPISPYTATWSDRLQGSLDSMVENSGNQSYQQYTSTQASRPNVVYVGANDGFLHGFRAGATDQNGNLITTTTPNDGQEVLAYMPGSTLLSAVNSGTTPTNCLAHGATQSQVQNIHGVTPAIGTTSALCVDASLDFANPQYGHNFFVDATPGTGDLFYPDTANPNGEWHTWLVGGLGAGGAAIYAIDITNPGNFAEGNASTVLLGEWNPSMTCAIAPISCGVNLGNTFGIPQIRRLHNGQWGIIFGNGFGSSTGDAGIYVMTVSFTAGKLTPNIYYLSTGQAGGNGIGYVTPVDLDGDHITDYVYAGDLNGNVWRFDLTSTNPANWAASSLPGGTTPAPLFTTPGQPITTQLLAISSTATGSPQKLMIEFATGQRTQVTNTTPVTFASGTQAIYGIWDWNMSAWNALSGTQYASLGTSIGSSAATVTAAATGLSSPFTIPVPTTSTVTSRLTAQTFSVNTTASASNGIVEGTNVTVCWQGSTTCSTGDNKFGWYVNFVGGITSPAGLQEQVIFSPVYFQGSLLVDSTVPADNVPTSCASPLDTGFTYALNVTNGGIFNNAFPTYAPTTGNFIGTQANDPLAAGVQTNATGSVYVVQTVEGKANIIYQTVTGSPSSQQINIPANTKSKRLTWVEKR